MVTGALAIGGVLAPSDVSFLVLPEMAVAFIVFIVMIRVVSDFMRVARRGEPWRKRVRGIGTKEARALSLWCPAWEKVGAWALAVIAFGVTLPGGRVTWSPGDEFKIVHVCAFIVGPTAFIFASIPFIASARRMPGPYSEGQPDVQVRGN